MPTVISGGPLLADARTLHRRGLVAFGADGVITYAGAAEGFQAPPGARLLDTGGGLIMPGLVNTHCHGAMTLFRGLADDLPLEEWLSRHMFPAEAMWVNEGMTELCGLLACAEMLLGGTTTVCDSYFCMDGMARACQEAGIRAVLLHGIIDFPAPGIPDPAKKLDVAERFVFDWKDCDPLITPGLFAHSTYTCSPGTLREVAALADDLGVQWQTHLSETWTEVENCRAQNGVTPPQLLERMGLLGRLNAAVHCCVCEPRDVELLALRGVGVASCPDSNMKLASGRAHVADMLARGVRVGLGTDGAASNNDLDMFGEMRSASLMAKVFGGDPAALPAADVFECATSGGAEVLGLGGVCGALAPGLQADVVVLGSAAPHLQPIYNPVSQLVYAAGPADVRHVFVAGRQRVQGGALTGLDLEGITARVRELAQRVVG